LRGFYLLQSERSEPCESQRLKVLQSRNTNREVIMAKDQRKTRSLVPLRESGAVSSGKDDSGPGKAMDSGSPVNLQPAARHRRCAILGLRRRGKSSLFRKFVRQLRANDVSVFFIVPARERQILYRKGRRRRAAATPNLFGRTPHRSQGEYIEAVMDCLKASTGHGAAVTPKDDRGDTGQHE
jgi:hypothetical protein